MTLRYEAIRETRETIVGGSDGLGEAETLELGLTDALALRLSLGLTLDDGEIDGDVELDGETLALGDRLGLALPDGLTDADGLTLALESVTQTSTSFDCSPSPSVLPATTTMNHVPESVRKSLSVACLALPSLMTKSSV